MITQLVKLRTLLYINCRNLCISLFLIMACEWSLPCQQLICKNAKSPDVNSIIIWCLTNKFRGHVVNGPAESHPSFVDRVSRPAKVAEFDME